MSKNLALAKSAPPTTTAEFLQAVKSFDYLQFIYHDLNGVARGQIIPVDNVQKLVTEGCDIVIAVLAFAYDGNPGMIQDHINYKFGNILIRPVVSTLRPLPSMGSASSTDFGQLFGEAFWLDGSMIEADPRAMAVRQIKRLNDRGLEILSGTEAEFRLFESHGSPSQPRPADDTVNMNLPRHYRQYERFFVQLDRYMRAQGFTFDIFHTEYGKGQLELAFIPEWGILAADNLARFKLLAQDAAHESGYRCSFMSKPMKDDTGNGFHFNHSIWRQNGTKKPTENVMFDDKDPKKLSAFMRHWLAGLLFHGNALTAVCSPTINCYRRLHSPWAPDYNDWGLDDRMTAIRVKNRGTPGGTYVENRCPSSATSPYLVMAAIIAAGLDGVDNKLELLPENSKELGALPRSLPAALEALVKDKVICEALGEQFIDWYVTLKEQEVQTLRGVDVSVNRTEDFQRETELYFDIA